MRWRVRCCFGLGGAQCFERGAGMFAVHRLLGGGERRRGSSECTGLRKQRGYGGRGRGLRLEGCGGGKAVLGVADEGVQRALHVARCVGSDVRWHSVSVGLCGHVGIDQVAVHERRCRKLAKCVQRRRRREAPADGAVELQANGTGVLPARERRVRHGGRRLRSVK